MRANPGCVGRQMATLNAWRALQARVSRHGPCPGMDAFDAGGLRGDEQVSGCAFILLLKELKRRGQPSRARTEPCRLKVEEMCAVAARRERRNCAAG